MKNIIFNSKLLLIGVISISLFFTACKDEDYLTGGPTYSSEGTVLGTVGTFDEDGGYGEYDKRLVDESIANYRLDFGGAAPSSVGVNITHDQSGASGKIGDVSSFPSEQSITFQQALDATGLSVDDLAIGDTFSVSFEVPGYGNATSFSISVFESGVVFRSALEGTFDATAVNTNQMAGIDPWDSCGEMGNMWEGVVSYEAVHTDPEATGEYIVYSVDGAGVSNEDISHGAYYPCYNSDAASLPLGDTRLTDVDGKIAIVGASQWGEVYTITNLTVAGAVLTFNWTNDYGEGALITLTRTDGAEWPANLTS